MKSMALLLASLSSFGVYAKEINLILGGVSKHYKDSGQNEIHPSVGIQVDNISVIYVDKNSIDSKSVQISYSDNFCESEYFDIGYRFGIASGYKKGTIYNDGKRYYNGVDIGGGLLPLVAIETTFHTPIDKFDVIVDVLPNVVVFGLKYKISE
ncbi:hypothetical protein ZPAH1_orf00393 [Aeromonas phage ZPAH1]|nr:hypothetical protein ASwh1_348 [Aeromonas phage Aswh_1]QQG34155.1 hypothetical protein ZPAH1_orf00393 [Aeromonas phage ZPAH1]